MITPTPAPLLTIDAPAPRRVKCRWCKKTVEATGKGYAWLWRHARRHHHDDLEAAGFPERQEGR